MVNMAWHGMECQAVDTHVGLKGEMLTKRPAPRMGKSGVNPSSGVGDKNFYFIETAPVGKGVSGVRVMGTRRWRAAAKQKKKNVIRTHIRQAGLINE